MICTVSKHVKTRLKFKKVMMDVQGSIAKKTKAIIYCSVPGCRSKGSKGFHHYPTNENLRAKWVNRTKTLHLEAKEIINSRICRKHFEEKDYEHDLDEHGRNRLRRNAVPSQYLPGPLQFKFEHNYAKNPKVKDHPTVNISGPQLPKIQERTNLTNHLNENSSNQLKDFIDIDDNNYEMEAVKEANISDEPGSNLLFPKASNCSCNCICELQELQKKLNDCMAEKATIAKKLGSTLKRITLLKQKQKETKFNRTTASKYLSQIFNKEQNLFFQMQLRNIGRKPHGRRFTPEEKSLSLASFKHSPKHYRWMDTFFILPTTRTLGRHSAYLHFRTGIDSKLFAFIEKKVKDMPDIDKNCTLSWDEVALQAHLDYDHPNDLIDGFVDLSTERKPAFATHSLTFMARGMNTPFKQAIGFFYTDALKAFELAALIRLVTKAVLKTGLIVIMSTCDQISSNGSAVHMLIDPNCPKKKSSKKYTGELLKYCIDGVTIIHCFDLPHLLKVVRNNFYTKDLMHCISDRWDCSSSNYITTDKTYTASWDDIEDTYLFDLQGTERNLKKISDEHINPKKLKMRVSVAAQVLSETYGKVILSYSRKKQLPRDCSGTAQELFFFNDLFDSLNGGGPPQDDSLKGSINEDSIHFLYWNYAITMLSKMNFIDKDTGNINKRSSVIYKFTSTIRGYIEVTKRCMNLNIKEVCLRYSNQDGLENFFGCIKFCNRVASKPIIPQYKTGYATMMVNNLTSSNSLSSNCEKYVSIPLLNNLHEFLLEYKDKEHLKSKNNQNTEHRNDHLNIIEFEKEFSDVDVNVVEDNALSYVSRVICRKILQITDCRKCVDNIQTASPSVSQDSISIKDDCDSTHKIPSENFIRNFKTLFSAIKDIIPHLCFEQFLKTKILFHIKNVEIDSVGCPEHNADIILKLRQYSVHYAITEFCQNINAIQSGKITAENSKSNHIQKLAFEFRKKG